MISRLEEGGWRLVHRQADRLIEPQPLQRSIREPSNSRRAAATQGDLDVESAQIRRLRWIWEGWSTSATHGSGICRSMRSYSVAAASPSTRRSCSHLGLVSRLQIASRLSGVLLGSFRAVRCGHRCAGRAAVRARGALSAAARRYGEPACFRPSGVVDLDTGCSVAGPRRADVD